MIVDVGKKAPTPTKIFLDLEKDKYAWIFHTVCEMYSRKKAILLLLFLFAYSPYYVHDSFHLPYSVKLFSLTYTVILSFYIALGILRANKQYAGFMSKFGPFIYGNIDSNGISFHWKTGESKLLFAEIKKVQRFIMCFRIFPEDGESQEIILLRHLNPDEIKILNSYSTRK